MANYNYVIDSHYKPYSLQELLVPYMLYKDAFEKTQQMSWDLKDKSDTFKYLSETLPEDSRARQIYENYANDLMDKSAALDRHGLTMTLRSGLSDMRRRYAGEIGRLEKAQTTLDKIKELRLQMGAKDPTMIYATNNLSIDSFLDGTMPNMYGISGNDLYQKGLLTGTAHSKAQNSASDIGSIIQGLYNDYVVSTGYDPRALEAFRDDVSTIPELARAVQGVLEANGVIQNITDPADFKKAYTNVLNGIIDGALGARTVDHRPIRNGMPTEKEKHDMLMSELNYLSAAANARKDGEGGDIDIVDIPLHAQEKLKEEAEDAINYQQYFKKDPSTGEYKLTEDGKKSLSKTRYSRAYDADVEKLTSFGDFAYGVLNKEGYDATRTKVNKLTEDDIKELEKRYSKIMNGDIYDAFSDTGYGIPISKSEAEEYSRMLSSYPLTKAEYAGKEGFKDAELGDEELDGYLPVWTIPTRHGIFVRWTNAEKPGNFIDTKLPKAVNPKVYDDLVKAAKKRSILANIINEADTSGRKPYLLKNGDMLYNNDGLPVYNIDYNIPGIDIETFLPNPGIWDASNPEDLELYDAYMKEYNKTKQDIINGNYDLYRRMQTKKASGE